MANLNVERGSGFSERREEVITISALIINELREAGLLAGIEPHVTDKGREWLRQLEELDHEQAAAEWAADLVESVNAISR